MDFLKAPTIHTSHTDDLIFETVVARVWRSRMTVEDGMPYNNQITIEVWSKDAWKTIAEFNPI